MTEASRNDQTDSMETSENISENDLVLRDMGYFSISVFQKTNGKKAFFLSRLPANVTVYDEDGKELDFKKLENFMSKNRIEQLEKQVLIGEKKMPVRLMLGLVPDSVYQQRLRRKNEEEKRKGHKTKERTKLLLRFNLFVTNTDAEKLPVDKIMPLYRFRWQVELNFKFWKSLYSIHNLQKMKEARYITMLYTRLILIVINVQIINRVQYILSKQEGGILSYHKALHTMKDKFAEVMLVLRDSLNEAVVILADIFRVLSKNHWREKRKKRENFIENIYLFICRLEN